jgi:ketopantoate reductase
LQAARAAGIGGKVEVSIPSQPGTAFTVAQTRQPWVMSNNAVAVDGATGRITDATWFADWPLAAKLSAWGIQLHMGTLQARIAQPVIPAVVYVATEMAGPGHLKHHGRGDLVIGDLGAKLPAGTPERVKAWFEGAGVPVTLSDNVAGELWAKLVVNCAYNALSAISQLPYGKMIQGPGIRDVMRDVVEETLAVAKASGVAMAPGMLERTYRIAEAMPTQTSSTAKDLERG